MIAIPPTRLEDILHSLCNELKSLRAEIVEFKVEIRKLLEK